MKFTKIRHRDGKTELHWTTPNGEDIESHVLVCEDAPTKPFMNAMKAIEGDYIYALELTKSKDGITLSMVSIDTDRHGNRGFVFSGVREVGAGTYAISAPRMREPTDDFPVGKPSVLTADQIKRIRKLETEAGKYADGMRSQRELPFDESAEEAATEEETAEATH